MQFEQSRFFGLIAQSFYALIDFVDFQKHFLVVLSFCLALTSVGMAEDDEKDSKPSISVYEAFQRGRTSHGGSTKRIVRRAFPVPKYSWDVDETKPINRIEIKLSEQKLYGYQGEVVAVVSDISSGKPKYDTPQGSFKVLAKNRHQKSNLYGNFVNEKGVIVNPNAEVGQTPPAGCHYEPSEMPFFMRLTDDGVGFHAGLLPGFAASHGCVRLPEFIAEKLFSTVTVGTPVAILP